MQSMVFWIITWLVISPSYGLEEDSFVITKYPLEIIAKYFTHLKRFTNNDIGEEFPKEQLHEICHKLRRSRVFIAENSSIQDLPAITNYTLRRKTLRTEKKQLHTQYPQLLVRDKSVPPYSLPTLKCLDIAGDMRWHITPAFVPDYAFLFTIDPRFHYVALREINPEIKLPPQLSSIIDKSASGVADGTVLTDSESDVLKLHFKKYKRSASTSGYRNRDILCDLNPIIQFRLCAIAVDSLHLAYDENENYSFESTGDGADADAEDDDDADDNDNIRNYYKKSYIYKYLKFSLYPQPQNPDESCRPLDIYYPSSRVPRRMNQEVLYCHTKITNDIDEVIDLRFYLRLNTFTDNISDVFMYHYDDWEGHTVVNQLDIPLLQHLSFYMDALKNFS